MECGERASRPSINMHMVSLRNSRSNPDTDLDSKSDYCKFHNLPTLYKYGVTRFGRQLSGIGSSRIEEFIKSYQPDIDERAGLQLVVKGCKEVFAEIQEISQQPNDYKPRLPTVSAVTVAPGLSVSKVRFTNLS